MTRASKDNRRVTVVLLIVFSVVLLVWDVYVATNEGRNDTISEVLRDISYDFWILPYMLMGVMGHLFWNRRSEAEGVFRPKVLVGSCVIVGARDLAGLAWSLPSFHYGNLAIGIAGFIVGAIFWPQGPKWDGEPKSGSLVDSPEE